MLHTISVWKYCQGNKHISQQPLHDNVKKAHMLINIGIIRQLYVIEPYSLLPHTIEQCPIC